jgi:predicted metal-dependent phosphoesterase TrpH
MGLTDHDSVFGVDEAFLEGKKNGVYVLKGLELSTIYKGKNVHIVTYFKNNVVPKEAYEFSKSIVDTRRERAIKMMENIRDMFNVKINLDKLLKGHVITRGNMYQNLLEENKDIDKEKLSFMVSNDSPAYIPASKLSTEDGVKMLRSWEGAFIIFAHPTLLESEYVEEVLQYGFDAIEARYPLNKEGDFERFKNLASKYNILISAGSDFHGDTKHADLGTSTLNEEEFSKIKERLNLVL